MDGQVHKLPGKSEEGSEPTLSAAPRLHSGTQPGKGISPTQPGSGCQLEMG